MIEIFTKMLVLYLFVSIVASGTDLANGYLTGFEHIFLPISNENGKFILLYMICNIAISLVTIILFLKRCDQHISMICYELKKNNRYKLLYSQKYDLYKCMLALVSAKFIIDLLGMIGLHSFSINTFIYSTVSYILTSILWLDALYTLRLFKVSSSVTFFVVTLGVFLSILIQRSSTLTFFAYCKSINEIYDYLFKWTLIILLHVLEIYKIKSADLY